MEDVMGRFLARLYQLYLIGGREAPRRHSVALEAGFSALVVTIDTPVAGMRERGFRNGMKELAGRNLLTKIPFLRRCCASSLVVNLLLDGGVPMLPNVIVPGQEPLPLLDVAQPWQGGGDMGGFSWIRQFWHGPIVVKGVLTAKMPDERWITGRGGVVSNHGGRQLDGAPASLDVLPEVVNALEAESKCSWTEVSVAVPMCSKQSAWSPCGPYWTRLRDGLAAAGAAGVARALEYCASTWSERCGFSLPVRCGVGPLLSQYPTE